MKLESDENKIEASRIFLAEDAQDQSANSLQGLLIKNLQVSEEILDLSKYIKRYIRWQKAFAWIKLLLIVIPIVWGLLYLPAILEESLSSYGLESLINPANVVK